MKIIHISDLHNEFGILKTSEESMMAEITIEDGKIEMNYVEV